MWTDKDITMIFLLASLLASLPFVYVFLRKMMIYLVNRYWPRDVKIVYKRGDNVVRSYYIKRHFLGRCEYYELDSTDQHSAGRVGK